MKLGNNLTCVYQNFDKTLVKLFHAPFDYTYKFTIDVKQRRQNKEENSSGCAHAVICHVKLNATDKFSVVKKKLSILSAK